MQSTRGPCPAPEPAPWSERPPAPHCDPRGSERPPGRPRPSPPLPGLISQRRPSPSSPRPGATARPRAQARRQGLSPAGKAVPAAAEGRARARASVTNALRVLLRRPRRLTEDSCSRPLPTRLCSQTGGDRSRKPGGRSPKGGQRGAARARRRPGGHGEAAALSSRRQRSRKRRAPRACAPRPAPPALARHVGRRAGRSRKSPPRAPRKREPRGAGFRPRSPGAGGRVAGGRCRAPRTAVWPARSVCAAAGTRARRFARARRPRAGRRPALPPVPVSAAGSPHAGGETAETRGTTSAGAPRPPCGRAGRGAGPRGQGSAGSWVTGADGEACPLQVSHPLWGPPASPVRLQPCQ